MRRYIYLFFFSSSSNWCTRRRKRNSISSCDIARPFYFFLRIIVFSVGKQHVSVSNRIINNNNKICKSHFRQHVRESRDYEVVSCHAFAFTVACIQWSAVCVAINVQIQYMQLKKTKISGKWNRQTHTRTHTHKHACTPGQQQHVGTVFISWLYILYRHNGCFISIDGRTLHRVRTSTSWKLVS